MKVLSRTSLFNQLDKNFNNKSNCHALITNFKQDRKIDIIKNQNNYLYRETGFDNMRKKNLTKAKVLQLVRKQIEIEFPNSKKIYYVFK